MDPYVRPSVLEDGRRNYQSIWSGGNNPYLFDANQFDSLALKLKKGETTENELRNMLGKGNNLVFSSADGVNPRDANSLYNNVDAEMAIDALRIAAGLGSLNPNMYPGGPNSVPQYSIGAGYVPLSSSQMVAKLDSQNKSSRYNEPMAVTKPGQYAAGTVLVRNDGQEFVADGSTVYGKSYKPKSGTTGQTPQVPALGTVEYTNYLIDQGKSLGMNLEQYRVPTNASGVTSTPGAQLPSPNPTM
jgi:hypothetical protein